MKLGQITAYIGGVTFRPEDVVPFGTVGAVACLRTKNVQEELDITDLIAVPRALVRRTEQLVGEGDILVSSANSWNLVGKCCYVPKLDFQAAVGGFISLLRPDPEHVEPRYLHRWLAWGETQHTVRRLARQTTNIANLPRERFLDLDVPLPPLAEQRRIAAILDEADALRRKRREALELLDELLRSAFLEMFGDPSMPHAGIPTASLGQLTSVRTGKTPSRADPANFGGGVPWVKTGEVDGGVILATDETLTPAGASGMELFPAGTVLVAMYGQGATRGRVAILGIEATTNQACAALLPCDVVEPEFVFAMLRLSYERLRLLGRGGNQENLNLGMVRDFVVPVPGASERRRFLAVVREIGHAYTTALSALDGADRLFDSLLHRAFRGPM